MKNLPVNWHEGLFLQPHHLQAADRYWTELTSTSQRWNQPYNYGVHEIKCGFEGCIFRVDVIHARLRGGTLISREENDPPLTIELDGALQGDTAVRIYLCVPQLRPRESNTQSPVTQGVTRYLPAIRELYDENQSGGNDQEIECRELNVRLLLETDDRAGYEQLPIAQVKRAVGDELTPQLDDTYIPPVIGIDAWVQLGRGIVRGIHDLLIQNINELTEAVRDINIRDVILEVTQSGRFALLDRLNESSCVLGLLVPAQGVHPLLAYVELCRLVGKLAIFTHEHRVPKLRRYDHDNIGPVFREVSDLIRRILESVQFKDYLQKNFIWEGDIMQAELTPAWFDPRVDWFIGVDRGGISDNECRSLLSTENDFLWKFASKDRDIRDIRAVGLGIKAQEQVIATLPPGQYWSYWRVPKEDTDHVYRAISNSHVMAVFMDDKNNRSFNPSAYVGTSRFPVARRNDEVVELQLALFGIRR